MPIIKICNVCGATAHIENAKYCWNCGGEVRDDKHPYCICGYIFSKFDKYCPLCSRKKGAEK